MTSVTVTKPVKYAMLKPWQPYYAWLIRVKLSNRFVVRDQQDNDTPGLVILQHVSGVVVVPTLSGVNWQLVHLRESCICYCV